ARTSSVKGLSRSLEELVSRSDYAEISGRDKAPAPSVNRRVRVYLPTAFAVLLAVLLLAGTWYHFKPPSSPTQAGQPGSPVSVSDAGPIQAEEELPAQGPGKPGDVYEGKDGAILGFVPGGEFRLKDADAAEGRKTITVQPFFMDKDEVTNHQYVEFLNKNISNIQIQGRTVNNNGEIWLFMGEIREGYEPIVFRNGSFGVKDPRLASHPVVRVTASGADAYARFYGRQLPSVNEWIHAAGVGHLFSDISKNQATNTRSARSDTSTANNPHSSMHNSPVTPSDKSSSPAPVGQAKPNGYGLTGLRGNVREWVVNPAARDKEDSYFIMGEFADQGTEPSLRPIARYPWEAFRNVGFRTIIRTR
ncbi:MAG: SUMF1/EgtB/PvdO family nonheme iron enzyme, partial [Deltaproteobacteria bacterium]|nr:SUMF1/EgtB/PvdO family nonheme iron enzyme [Deltaproteobacteria bacterium]